MLKRGAAVFVDLMLPEETDITAVTLSAEAVDGPEELRYSRSRQFNVDENITLFGLCEGRFKLKLSQTVIFESIWESLGDVQILGNPGLIMPPGKTLWEKVVVVEGTDDVDVEVDLR